MPWFGVLAVGGGAAVGAWMRWCFGEWLNPMFPTLPLGTLTANLLGGLMVGIVMALSEPLQLSYTTRLLVVTGFLGGLTTFSTFSAETVALMLNGRFAWAMGLAAAHLGGSLLMTGIGVALARFALARIVFAR